MTTIEFKAELAEIHRQAEEADKRLADFVVTIGCFIGFFAVILVCVEVLL